MQMTVNIKMKGNVCHRMSAVTNVIIIKFICLGVMTESNFYKKAANYWANVPATMDGVLGGFGYISDIDIDGSRAFLHKVLTSENPPRTKLALDCGADISRVAKYLLIPQFETVELVKQDEKFINTAKQSIGEDNTKLGALYIIGLQHFKPQKMYDVIWCQWVLGYLNNYDLISFLERCSDALAENGLIIVKENITTTAELEYDEEDYSVTRPYDLMKRIFDAANLKIIITDIQIGFPEHIYPVHTFALSKLHKCSFS